MDRPRKFPPAALIAPLLASLTVVAFLPLLVNEFIRYDDTQYILENPHVLTGLSWANIQWAFGSAYAANWHPLTWISHMVDVQLFGLRPGWHHFSSLLLHVANALLLWMLLKRLTGATWRSAAVAALFAVHPLHVESVAWAAERKDVLSTLFFVLTLLAYERHARTSAPPRHRHPEVAKAPTPPRLSSRYYYLSLLFFALGLMCKPMLVTLPFLLMLLDFWPLRRLGANNLSARTLLPCVIEKMPFFILSLGSCVITYMAQTGSHAVAQGFPLGTRLMNAGASYLKYLVKMIWPVDLTIIYPHPALSGESLVVPALAGGLLIAGLSAVAVVTSRRSPWLAVGWFWYLGTLIPVIGLVQAGNQGMADRYTYVPLIGIFICLVWGATEQMSRLRAGKAILAGSATLALVACALATHHQVKYWKENLTLFSHALNVTKNNALAHINVGADLGQQGKFDLAEKHFRAALAEDPRCTDANYYLGLTYELTGKTAEAVAMYQETLRALPTHDLAMSHLGAALIKLGRADEGLERLARSALMNPSSYFARSELGRALADCGELGAAAEELSAAAKLKPNDPQILSRLAEIEFKRGRLDHAEQLFDDIVRLEPARVEMRLNLAGTLWKRGQFERALRQYGEATRLDPQNANARFSYGAALALQSRPAEAAAQFSEATRLKPDFGDAWTELGRALAAQNNFGGAQAAFERAVLLSPTNVNLQLNLANALMLSGRTNEASKSFARALELQPGLPERFLQEGENLCSRGQWSTALARFKTALWLRPEDPEAQRSLAWVLATHPQATARNGPEALRLASSALAKSPGKAVRFWSAYDAACAEVGDFAKAIESAEKAREAALAQNDTAMAQAAETRLSLYRQQKPFHQNPGPAPRPPE